MDVLIGKVIHNPMQLDSKCIYVVQAEDKEYSVVSENYQAVKDKIFINVGQTVEIQGKIEKDTMYTRKSRIILKR